MQERRSGGPTFGAVALAVMVMLLSSQASSAASRIFVSGPTGLITDPSGPEAISFAQDGKLYALNQAGNISVFSPEFETLTNGSLALTGYSTLNQSLKVGGDTMVYAPDVNTLYVASSQTDSLVAVRASVSYTNGTIAAPPRIVANISLPYPTFLDCVSGDTLYLLDGYDSSTGNNNITEVDTRTNAIVKTVEIPLGSLTFSIACGDLRGEVFLGGFGGVAMVNVTSGTSTWIYGGSGPPYASPVVFDQANGLVYAIQGDNVIAVNPNTAAMVANISLPQGSAPFATLVDTADNLIFLGSMLNQIDVIDGNSNTLISTIPASGVPMPFPSGLALDPVQRVLYTGYLQGAIQVNSFSLEGVATQTLTRTVTASLASTQTLTERTTATFVSVSTLTGATTYTQTSVATVVPSANQGSFAVIATLGTLSALVIVETLYILRGKLRL